MKTVGFTDYTNQTPLRISDGKNVLSSTPVKKEKMCIKCAQYKNAHIQCVNNHFECKGLKNVGVTDYTNQTPCKHVRMENV